MNDPFASYRVPTRRVPSREQSEAEKIYSDIADQSTRQRQRKRQRNAVTRITPNPDKEAEARTLGASIGQAAVSVVQDLPGYKAQKQQSDIAELATDERVGNWLGDNAEIASDDAAGLTAVKVAADAFQSIFKPAAPQKQGFFDKAGEFVTALPGRLLGSGSASAAAGLYEVLDPIAEAGALANLAVQYPIQAFLDATGAPGAGNDPYEEFEKFRDSNTARRDSLRAEAQGFRERNSSSVWALEQILSGTESVLPTVAGVLTRNPRAALGVPVTSVGGNEYREARDQGLDVTSSIIYGGKQATTEFITEKIPVTGLVKILEKGTPFGKALAKQLYAEIPGEQAATLIQDMNAWASLPENRDKTLKEFVGERPEAALSTLLATVGGTTTQTAIVKSVEKAARKVSGIDRDTARLDALDRIVDEAAESKTRARDPEAFRDLIDGLVSEDETITIPASAIQTFNQDYENDAFFGDYAEEIDEAILLGGDVSIPVSDVAARLAGTPEWDAIKDDVRPAPLSSSRNEIAEAQAELDEVRAEAAEQLDQEDIAARRAAAPAARLRETIRSQLLNTGQTPDVATANAEITASLFETEAAREGRQVIGNEFSSAISVQRVLPELLASPEASDTLDLVINALRQGNDANVGIGPSLLQFISGRGGINDTGGDLAAIGLPNRFIRDFDPAQASITGISDAGDFGLDTVLRAAIEEGFFPELQNAEREGEVSELDTNDLIAAIQDELGGEKRYSETRFDQIRAAADELGALLSSRGIDVNTLSDAEIRDAVNDIEAESGPSYNQDTIDKDIANEILDDSRVSRGFSFKENKKIWRGEGDHSGDGMATYGLGDYSTTNKSYAKKFGDVREVSRTELADSPIRFDTVNDWQIWLQQAEKKLGYKSKRDFVEDYDDIGKFIRALDPKIDGLQIGPASDAIIVTYPVIEDARILHQGETPQGQIEFHGSDAIIKMFENSNASTFQHEMAHFWLERLKTNDNASDDYAVLKKWFSDNGHAVTDDGVIPTEAHEMFARGWERYLMEGKAPKTSLQSAFRKFAGWMRGIYRAVKNLNAPITPEVRSVMDRMLATDEEIASAVQERELYLMFDDAIEAGMTDEEAKRYAELGQDARNEAEEELFNKVYRSVRARETKQWKAQEKVVRDEVRTDVESRPLFKALDLLRGDRRLDRDWIVDNYGEDALKLLPAGVPPVYRKKGDDADIVAEMAGFESGDKMVLELLGLEARRKEMKASGDKRSVKNATIDQEVVQEMDRRFDDPLTDGTIEREAQAAVQNERQGERLEMELRALGSRTQRRPTPYAMAREWARDRIARGIISETISGEAQYRYTRTAAKAARDAQTEFLRGNNEEAFRHKQTEMLNNALAREASKASDAAESAIKRMGKLAKQRTVKSMAQDYLDRIHGLLEGYEFKRVSQRQINARDEYTEWAAAQTEAGHDVVPVARLAQSKNWSRLTVEELTALDDAVKQLQHLGRHKQTLLDGKERREFGLIRGEALAKKEKIGVRKKKSAFLDPSWWDSIKSGVATADAGLLKMEQVFDWLDTGDSNGVWNRIVFRPVAAAQEQSRKLTEEYFTKLRDAADRLPDDAVKKWQEKVTIDLLDPKTGDPIVMERKRLVAMALNWGNAGNRQRLVDGYGWNEANVEAALMDNMTEADWNYVQEVWDIINGLWPAISEMEKRVNGFAPDKVEAVEVVTPFGKLKGGYYPAIYDSTLNPKTDKRELKEGSLLQNNYTRATTRASSTKERSEQVSRPILLDTGVITRHIGEVIHDVTHREAVMNAHKFINDEAIIGLVDDTLGPEIRKQFQPWLNFIANQWAHERAGNEGLGKFMGKARANTTVVGMGWRATTIITQIAGYSNSAEFVGAKYLAPEIAKFTAQLTAKTAKVATFRGVEMPEMMAFAMERSQELPARLDTLDRDIRREMKRLSQRGAQSKGEEGLTAVKRFAFHGIGYMDRVVSIPTWMAEYNKSIAAGMTEKEAAYAGDKAVRLSQGAGSPKDLAAVSRGTGRWGEAMKLMTMFYSYLSAVYSRQRNLGRDVASAETSDIPNLVARAWWLLIVPPIMAELVSGRGPEEDEEFAEWAMLQMARQSLGAIPGVRDVVEPAWNAVAGRRAFDYRLSPTQGVGQSFVNVAEDVGKVAQGKETKRATRNTLEAIGYATGLVPGQVAQSVQFLVDIGYGEQNPDDIADWWQGITKGKIKD